MGLLKFIHKAEHGLSSVYKKTTHGLSSAASAAVHVVEKVAKPVYEHVLKPVGKTIGKKASKYEEKAEDFLDASIDTVVGTQQAIAAMAQNASSVGVQFEDSVGQAAQGLGSFLESGLSWYLVAGGGAIVAMLVLLR
jgi:ElaB/YqjD/DUF883 family membrane-anchored ribosome-binding protein